VTRWEEPISFEEDHNRFALALYREVREIRRNVCFSPFSIRMALAMAYAGARGNTASQMKTALCFGSSDQSLHRHFADVLHRFNAARDGTCDVSVANSLWVQDGAPLLPEFVDLVARHYGSILNVTDFCRPDVALLAINQWIEDATKGRIPELLDSGALPDETRLVLANAVHFKGTWELKFDRADTRDEPFYVEGGGTVTVPLMYQKEELRYLQESGFQAVNLDFEGGDASMIVLLPDTNDGLWNLETRVDAAMLRDCFPRMVEHEVKLSLPRFKMTWGSGDVQRELQALGMPMPFDRLTADFSGINGHRPPEADALFISAVVHKAFVEVNEEGAEAAAATALTVDASMGLSAPVVTFRADHPFLFAIRDTRTDAILFLGRVADPTMDS
jgi:serpin B